jgi:hypothetical protein
MHWCEKQRAGGHNEGPRLRLSPELNKLQPLHNDKVCQSQPGLLTPNGYTHLKELP